MPANPKLPLTIFTGQNTALRAATLSHGDLRPDMVQEVSFDPKMSSKRIDEYDNLLSALTYYTFDGVSGSLKYSDNNQQVMNALLMDRDPTASVGMLNPSVYKPFILFGNQKGLDGKIKRSFVAYRLTQAGHPYAGPLKEAANRTLNFEGLNFLLFDGLAIQYTRARGTTTIQAPPAQPALATSTTGGYLVAGTYYVQLTGVTAAGETTAGNEAAIHIPTGTVTNKVTITIPALGAFTSYNVYVSDKSNGERFSVNSSTPGGLDITTLPSTTSYRPPLMNTSGSYAATDDKVFTGGGPYTVTLDNAAYKLADTGLDYVLVMKDGEVFASVDGPATGDTFLFDSTGATFSVNEDPATHVWEAFTLYQP